MNRGRATVWNMYFILNHRKFLGIGMTPAWPHGLCARACVDNWSRRSSFRYARILQKIARHVGRNEHPYTTTTRRTRQWMRSPDRTDRRSAVGFSSWMNLCLIGLMWFRMHIQAPWTRMGPSACPNPTQTCAINEAERTYPNPPSLSVRKKFS